MRILLLSTYFRPDIASTGMLMTQLAEELALLGHQIVVVTSLPHYDTNRIWDEYRGRLVVRERQGLLDVRRVYLYVPQRKENLLGRLLNYASFNMISTVVGALAGQYDVVLVPSPPLTNGIAAFLISRLRGVPFVYNVQDIYPDIAIRLGVMTNPQVIAAFRTLEKFVYRKAAAVSVISEGFRLNLLAKGVPDSKLHVIPNFVDPELMRTLPRRNSFSRRHDLDDRFVVLFAGNVGLSQGLEGVLDAADLLAQQQDVLFLIVGNGAAKADLVARARSMGLENTRFLPFQPHEVVPEMYASADVCLVPLRRGLTEQSVPCKVYTIMGAGKPLVASVDEASDTWQLVRTADCGLCIEPESPQQMAEAILDVYRDGGLRQEMGRRGRQYVESHFTPYTAAQQYAQLLTAVVDMQGAAIQPPADGPGAQN
jgi:colanic acid biosynthesis glycosyl transferase WcaI